MKIVMFFFFILGFWFVDDKKNINHKRQPIFQKKIYGMFCAKTIKLKFN